MFFVIFYSTKNKQEFTLYEKVGRSRRMGENLPPACFALSGYPPALIVPYQQLVDRFPFLGDGADRAKDAQPLDMEAVV